jgi:hypothetical protein
MWMAVFSIITATFWINRKDLEAMNCVFRKLCIKVNITKKDTKYEKKNTRLSIHSNTKESK